MNICWICLRTDALKPGHIDHDQKWHDLYKKYKAHVVNQFTELPKLEFISLKGI